MELYKHEAEHTEHFACKSKVNAGGIDLRVDVDGVAVDIAAARISRAKTAGTAAPVKTRN